MKAPSSARRRLRGGYCQSTNSAALNLEISQPENRPWTWIEAWATPTKRKSPIIRIIIEENPYLSQKKIAQTLFLQYDIVKRLITAELNLQQGNFKCVPHTITTSQKLERVRISRKLFTPLKLQVNDLAYVIMMMKSSSTLKIRDRQCG
jgi:hypothetical protein